MKAENNWFAVLALALPIVLATHGNARAESACARDYRAMLHLVEVNRADEINVRSRLAAARKRLAAAKDELERHHAADEVQGLEQALRDVRMAGRAQRQLAEAMRGLGPDCPQEAARLEAAHRSEKSVQRLSANPTDERQADAPDGGVSATR